MDQTARVQTPSTSTTSSSPRHGHRRRHERDQADPHPTTPPQRRILVSGYPNYTQPHDLTEVFAKFGNVRIDKCNSFSATLTFTTEEEVKAALGANKRLHVYGYYLSVRRWGGRPQAPTHHKQEFPMSKQKCVIVEPKKIDMSGDFHHQLDNILAAVRLTQEDVKALSQLYTDLENALQLLWPGCKAVPFGSITTGLGIKTSDADCFIIIPSQFRQPNGNYVHKAKRVLMQNSDTFAEILAIPRANTPIVKFFHIPTNTNCDVTFKTPLGAQNSRLIAFLLHSDPRLLPMSVIIKYWAKVHDLSGTGKLTNYALALMIIFYLQQPPMSILPSIAWLQRDPADAFIVDHWNAGFMQDPALLPLSSNTSSISELIGGFFEYYSTFNFDEIVVCPYIGAPLKKDIFKEGSELPDEFERYKNNVINNNVLAIRYQTPICVQDPFEQCHNVASTITSRLAADINAYFKFAANAYEKEKLNSCQEFLKIILLQKPKLIRSKTHPEYRINIYPKILNTIINFNWKNVVRDLVMAIFENMLKIKLGKVEEKVNPDSKKEKEKYTGEVTKAIWKRKSFAKLYSILEMSLEEKQAKITDEVINIEKQVFSIQFQLTLTYSQAPKNAVISIRLGAGEIELFREFGKFFISVMQNWVMDLLKPYSTLNGKDTPAKKPETMEIDNNENNIDTDDGDEELSLVQRSRSADKTPMTNNIEETLTKMTKNTEETFTNDSEKTLVENSVDILTTPCVETLTNNIEESLATEAEIFTQNTETFSKNSEPLIKSAVINETSTDGACVVPVACVPE